MEYNINQFEYSYEEDVYIFFNLKFKKSLMFLYIKEEKINNVNVINIPKTFLQSNNLKS